MTGWHYILDPDDPTRPISCPDTQEWAEWFEMTRNRVLAQTDFGVLGVVSTVFLGIDHSFATGGPPLFWETMVLGSAFGDSELQWRERSFVRAAARHRMVVRQVSRLVARWGSAEAADSALRLGGSHV